MLLVAKGVLVGVISFLKVDCTPDVEFFFSFDTGSVDSSLLAVASEWAFLLLSAVAALGGGGCGFGL